MAAVTITSPIWRDVYIDVDIKNLIGSADYVSYRIQHNQEYIYYGKVYYFNNKCRFKINDICRDYLKSEFNFSQMWTTNTDHQQIFRVYISTDDFATYTEHTVITFTYDYSYMSSVNDNYLSDPIQDVVDYRQLFVASSASSGYIRLTLSGSSTDQTSPFNNPGTQMNVMFQPQQSQIGQYISITGTTDRFKIEDTCNRYCLYYINPRGGWDWLLINGSSTKQYNYSRKYYEQNFNNDSLQFGKVNYLSDISEKWTLNTGYMSENQSIKMFNIFSSSEVYLHDLVDDFITPVNITNTTQDEKLTSNQNKKLITYTINIESAQNKIRK